MSHVIAFLAGAACATAVPYAGDLGRYVRIAAARAWHAVTVGRPRE